MFKQSLFGAAGSALASATCFATCAAATRAGSGSSSGVCPPQQNNCHCPNQNPIKPDNNSQNQPKPVHDNGNNNNNNDNNVRVLCIRYDDNSNQIILLNFILN